MYKPLKAFITHARRQTYASGKKPALNKGKIYLFEDGEFTYQDLYYDRANVFQGQEIVFSKNVPIWSFSYRGIVKDHQDAKAIFSILRSCLRELAEARFHTSCTLSTGSWKYACKGKGRFENFSGRETIYHANTLAYWMTYFGGILDL